MRKTEALRIICQAAKIYDEQLCNKKLLIIYNAPNKPEFIEALASPSNFLHLTGIKLNGNSSADSFYRDACDRKIKESDFDFKDHTTEQKLNVLVQTLRISTNAKIIGDFNNSGLKLQTDKLAGSVYSCLGFVKTDNSYVPNTVLEDDIRKNVNGHHRVLAIIRKHIDEPSYNEIKYVAKNIDVQRLLDKIKDNISIDEKLLKGSGDALSAPNVSTISYTPVSYSGGAAVLSPVAPSENIRSFFNKVKNSIVGAFEKKAKQPSTNNETELRTLKEQLLQKDEEIAQKDRTIAKKSEEIAKKGDQIDELIKASEAIAEEKNKLSEIAKNQNNKILQINSWLNANPDIKERLLKDKKEHRSVFASSPSENLGQIDTKSSDMSKSAIKQAHKPKNKKGCL